MAARDQPGRKKHREFKAQLLLCLKQKPPVKDGNPESELSVYLKY